MTTILLATSIAVILRITRSPCLRNAFRLSVAAILFSSCSQKAKLSLFEGTGSQEAVRKLTEKMPSPVRVLSIEITPVTLTIQVQDPAVPSYVNEYTYRNLTGLAAMIFPAVSGPTPVKLSLINPKLEENLFNLEQLNLGAVPAAVREAVRRVALDGGGAVESIRIQRQVGIFPSPFSGDIEWVISVHGSRESASAYADAQGCIDHLNLSGTRRAETLDYTEDREMLADAIGTIRSKFGSGAIFNHISVSRLTIGFTVRDEKDPNETHAYGCDINGIHRSLNEALNFKPPKNPFEEGREYFSIDDADWSRVPSIKKIALEKIVLPNGNVLDLELSKPRPTRREEPLRWRVQVISGVMGEYGFALFDPKSGQLTGVELPPSQIKPVDFLNLARSLEFLADIREDFGPAAQFQEINIDSDRAWVKTTAPAHPNEIREYHYNAAKRADPGIPSPIKSPFDPNLGPKDFFGADEIQGFESRLGDLEKKTLDRLRLTNGTINRLTFFRQNPIYPDNKKLLLEIRCEGKGEDGRILYDLSGNEFDIVGGNPSGPIRTTAPPIKSGLFFGSPRGTTSAGGSHTTTDQDIDALFDQWQAVMNADAAAKEKCSATRWGQLAEKGPVTPADISLDDWREYRLAELGRIETAKKCLAFLERPKTKARMPQLMATTEAHGLNQRKFFDLQFWRATNRRMIASNELKRLTEEHWEEFLHSGLPAEGPNLKAWQRKYLHLEAEEKAAREERHRIIAKYEGG